VSELDYGVSITDGCISWDETHKLIHETRTKLITVLPLRQQKRADLA
jgi:3-deoxy-7-phosphoheptulonate synthase